MSPSPDRKEVSTEEYLRMAGEMAEELFGDFNCVYAIHTDSKYRHIHFILNSVSYVDGKRFHSSKSDLAEVKRKTNGILEKYGFDIIRTSTDEMIDDTPYDLTESMDFLEITESEIKLYDDFENWTIGDICTSSGASLHNCLARKDNEKKKESEAKKFHPHIFDCGQITCDNNIESEEIPMNNYNSFAPKVNAPVPVPAPDTTAVPAVSKPTEPVPSSATSFPTLTLNFAPKINLNVTAETTEEDIKNYINTTTPKINTANCFKAVIATASELDKRNISMNIEANLFPDITINVTDGSDKSNDNVIDVEPNNIW